jgi:hypothetical protein
MLALMHRASGRLPSVLFYPPFPDLFRRIPSGQVLSLRKGRIVIMSATVVLDLSLRDRDQRQRMRDSADRNECHPSLLFHGNLLLG